MGGYEIKYVRHKQVDKKKWDDCISAAPNGLIYVYSYYLDMMSPHWDALVWEDYALVMPLTWKNKFGIHYLFQPFLTAQMGVFGKNINPQVVEAFIQAIPTSFRLVEIPLNSGNHPVKHKHIISRNNYILDMESPYEKLYEKYNANTKRNIKKAKDAGCSIRVGININDLVTLALRQMRADKSGSEENVKRFLKLYDHLHHNNAAVTYGVFSKENFLIASAVFFIMDNRAYYILVGNHDESKLVGASHFLIDAFIHDHAGKNMILDFEGSDLPSLAFFYSGFGATNEKYPFLKMNRLPFYLKWLKN
jgi:hypothetical protein